MKSIILSILMTCLSLTFLPVQANDSKTLRPLTSSVMNSLESSEDKSKRQRDIKLNERAKSKSSSTEKDKQQCDEEASRHHRKEMNRDAMVSVSTGLLIVLLLILIF